VKLQSLIAASALICKRKEAVLSDLWVLKYIWDTEEQVEILEGMVNAIIEKDKSEKTHPQAFYNKSPNADEVMKEVLFLQNKWKEEGLSLEEKNVVKDKLRYVQSRCDWIHDREQKEYIQKEIDKLWKQILEDV
ncbi:MAG TPA: ATPase, partial [Chitinophagaceae bacterium]|nr:ATPase [Chitinophagaceae bacterium]